MDIRLIKISPATVKNKRYTAHFLLANDKIKKVHFGSDKHENFSIHGDEDRKASYLKRHAKNEDWGNPLTAGSLSRYILWNKTTLHASIKDFKKRFGI